MQFLELDDTFADEALLRLLILLYTDDTFIVSNNSADFKNSLNDFSDYCSQWKLTVNANKSNVIALGDRNRGAYNFNIGEHVL